MASPLLALRGRSANTIAKYVCCVRRLAEHYGRSHTSNDTFPHIAIRVVFLNARV